MAYRAILASQRWPLLYWLLLGMAIIWLYWPAFCGRVPAFRDAYHFYYPLEVWLATRAELGQYWPHFNPHDGIGVNLIGETSSGLCYPGRVLWWIPGFTVAQRFGLVLAFHTFVAAIGAAYAAKRMQLSAAAGCLAATAYALGGAVLFQHVNPIYLIGAAWTPWALGECWVLAHGARQRCRSDAAHDVLEPPEQRKPRMTIWVAAASLMLLGGDPEATVNTGIVTVLALITRWGLNRSWIDLAKQTVWLACAVLVVTGVTAIQWIPARYWLQHSQRSAVEHGIDPDEAAPLAQLPQLLRPIGEALQQERSEQSLPPHRGSGTFAYSVAPWHLLTLIWGTGGGHFLPEHSHWLQAFSAEPRMWTASLSIGLLPVLCVVVAWSGRSTRASQRFLIVVAVVAGFAMLGNYAPVWMLRQLCNLVGAVDWSHRLPADEVGGMYWCFTNLVPGYAAFRYPAKWSIWFACALVLAAAAALDRCDLRARGLFVLCVVAGSLSSLAAIAAVYLQVNPEGLAYAGLSRWLAAAPADPWLGRPDAATVTRLWLHTAIMAAAMALSYAACVRLGTRAERLRALLIVLTLIELSWAGKAWLVTVDMNRLPKSHATVKVQAFARHNGEPATHDSSFERVWTGIGRADFESWAAAVPEPDLSPEQQVEKICTYAAALELGKLHLLDPEHGNLSALVSLTPRVLSTVRYQLAQADDLSIDNPALDEALAWLGVSKRLTAGDGLAWQTVPNARPLVELETAATQGVPTNPSNEACIVEQFSADFLRVRVIQKEASRLVVRLFQDGGWSARLKSTHDTDADVLQRVPSSTHLGLFQSLEVPAGDWTIELSYRAPGWALGVAITLSTLALWLVTLIYRSAYRTSRLASPMETAEATNVVRILAAGR